MTKSEHLEAVAKAFSIPIGELIDFCTSGGQIKRQHVNSLEDLHDRIKKSEDLNLSTDYINGLKDAYKLMR